MRMLVNIDVPDLDRAIRFYCSALNLQFSRTLDDDVAELVGTSSLIYLLKKNNGSVFSCASGEVRDYKRHWTPVHIDFVVDDIDAAIECAVTAGAHVESECIDWKGSKCVTFSDPFGHGFCLIQFEGESYSNENR